MIKRRPTPQSTLIPLLAATSLLAACAGKLDLVACPEVTAPVEGLSAFQLMDETRAVVDIRFNGVKPVCDLRDDGSIRMDLAIGLKLKRLGDAEAGDVVSIDIASAVVNSDDVVLRTDMTTFQAGFAKGEQLMYPVAEHRIMVNPGERVVLSLLPGP